MPPSARTQPAKSLRNNWRYPSGTPHPDGVQRIHNASHKLTQARDEMMNAHNRMNDFIERGIVPEDLKRSG